MGKDAGFIFGLLLRFGAWAGSGYLCYQWLEPSSFGSVVIFLLIWHAIATVLWWVLYIIAIMNSSNGV